MFFMYYALFVLIPYIIDVEQEMAQHRHLRELGYDYACPLSFLEKMLKEIRRYAIYFIPMVNIWCMIDLMDSKYPRISKKDAKKMLDRGEVFELSNALENGKALRIISSRKNNMRFGVADLTKEALIEQAYAIKIMNQSDNQNLVENWRDLSTDTKIQLLLGELEALYFEKAAEMGIELNDELTLYELERNQESEEAQKKLKNK